MSQTTSNYDQAVAQAKAQADENKRTHDLAMSKGDNDTLRQARLRLARQFIEIHIKDPSATEQLLSKIDLRKPMMIVDRKAFPPDAQSGGILSIFRGTPDRFLVGDKYPPTTPEGPLIALKYGPMPE
jgi:hypothetical protein